MASSLDDVAFSDISGSSILSVLPTDCKILQAPTMSPIPLDDPVKLPAPATMCNGGPFPKRQRALSEVSKYSTCSFDACQDVDFYQILETFDLPSNESTKKSGRANNNAIKKKRIQNKAKSSSTRQPSSSTSTPLLSRKPANAKPNISPVGKKPAKTRTTPTQQPASTTKAQVSKPRRVVAPSVDVSNPVPSIPTRCTPEERKAKVARYLTKRSRRVWRKEIKYSCRKQFAESRPRVAGRFIPKSLIKAQEASSLKHDAATTPRSCILKTSIGDQPSAVDRHNALSPMSSSSLDSTYVVNT